jgi:hypothetical protein
MIFWPFFVKKYKNIAWAPCVPTSDVKTQQRRQQDIANLTKWVEIFPKYLSNFSFDKIISSEI